MDTGLVWADVGEDGFLLARSGRLTVGLVVVRYDGTVVWEIDGVSTKHVVEGYGETQSVAEGKDAFERAWNVWLEYAGLVPATPEASEIDAERTDATSAAQASIRTERSS